MADLFLQPFELQEEQLSGAQPGCEGLTCMNGLGQRGLVLRGQQSLVITGVALQLFQSATGCHPDPGAVLAGHTFAHVPFHFEKDRRICMNTRANTEQRGCVPDPSPVRFFSM